VVQPQKYYDVISLNRSENVIYEEVNEQNTGYNPKLSLAVQTKSSEMYQTMWFSPVSSC